MGTAAAMKWLDRAGSRTQSGEHWKATNYVALDLETTGLDLRNDEIISIGFLEITNGTIIGSSQTYVEVKPNQKPSIAAMQVHSLRAVDLENAQSMKEITPNLKDRLHGKVLVAHAAWIEKSFLQPHLGRSLPSKVIDTAALARARGYGADSIGHEPSLEFLARQLNLPVYSPHHALGDALTTAVVFLALATELERKLLDVEGVSLSFSKLLEISNNNQFHK